MTALLLAYLKTGLLVSLAVVGLLLTLPLLDRRYTARWRCRVWVALAVLLLLPLPSLPGRAALRLTLPETAAEPLAGPLFSALPGGGQNAAGEQASGAADAPTVLDTAAGQEAAQQGPAQQEGGGHPPSGGLASSQQTGVQPPAAAQPQRDADGSDGGVLPGPQRPQKQPLSPLSPLALCAAAWAAGAALLGFWRLAAYLWARRRALRWARPVTDACTLRLFRLACAGLGRRAPRLLQAPGLAGPLTAGLLRPVLLLPEKAVGGEDLPLILAHELTHLRRHDLAKKALLLAANTLHWPNPAAWLLLRRAQRDIELACDEAVTAGRGADYRDRYCGALLNSLAGARERALLPGARFARGKKEVRARLAHLFDRQPKRRGRAAAALLLAAVVTCSALVACTAPESLSASLSALSSPATQPDYAATQSQVTWPDREKVYLSFGDGEPYLSTERTISLAQKLLSPPDLFDDLTSDPYFFVHPVGSYVQAAGRWDLVFPREESPAEIVFFRSQDDMASWERWIVDLTPLLEGETLGRLVGYELLNEQDAFLTLTSQGEEESKTLRILHSSDGGQSWSLQGVFAPGQLLNIRHAVFVNPQVGFASAMMRREEVGTSRGLYRTVDGGKSWQPLDLSPALDLLPVQIPATCCLQVQGEQIVVGLRTAMDNDQLVLRSSDYGENWEWTYSSKPLGVQNIFLSHSSWDPLTPQALLSREAQAQAQVEWTERYAVAGRFSGVGDSPLLVSQSGTSLPAPESIAEALDDGAAVAGTQIPALQRWELALRDPRASDSVLFFTSTDEGGSWRSRTADFSDFFEDGRKLDRVAAYEPLGEQQAFLALVQSEKDTSDLCLRLFRTRDGGESWQNFSSSAFLPDAEAPLSLRALNPEFCFAVISTGGQSVSGADAYLCHFADIPFAQEILFPDLAPVSQRALSPEEIWTREGEVILRYAAREQDGSPPFACFLRSGDHGRSWEFSQRYLPRANPFSLELNWTPLPSSGTAAYEEQVRQAVEWPFRAQISGRQGESGGELVARLAGENAVLDAPAEIDGFLRTADDNALSRLAGSHVVDTPRWDLALLSTDGASLQLFHTKDSGNTWQSRQSELPLWGTTPLQVCGFDRLGQDLICLGVISKDPVSGERFFTLLRSRTDGESWTSGVSLALGRSQRVVAARMVNAHTSFLLLQDGGEARLLRSRGTTGSWEEIPMDGVLKALPRGTAAEDLLVEGKLLVATFAGTDGRRYELLSADQGKNWSWRAQDDPPHSTSSFFDLDDPSFTSF